MTAICCWFNFLGEMRIDKTLKYSSHLDILPTNICNLNIELNFHKKHLFLKVENIPQN